MNQVVQSPIVGSKDVLLVGKRNPCCWITLPPVKAFCGPLLELMTATIPFWNSSSGIACPAFDLAENRRCQIGCLKVSMAPQTVDNRAH